jgi:hypothetical protein
MQLFLQTQMLLVSWKPASSELLMLVGNLF